MKKDQRSTDRHRTTEIQGSAERQRSTEIQGSEEDQGMTGDKEAPEDLSPSDDGVIMIQSTMDDFTIDVEVINHLLFHKAIGEGGIHIDKYLAILKGITEGDHLTMVDPQDRTTALVFELVIQENFNPWDIDLKRFSLTYLKRLKSDLDFITAGRLIFMAYRVLRLQSTELLESLSVPDDEDYDDYMEIEGWMEDDASYNYTRRVVEMKNPPIEEAVMHRGDRRVTLFELVEAFNEAAEETEQMKEHNIRMREERNRIARLRRRTRQRVGDKVHDEDFKEDIRKVHEALMKTEMRRLSFSELASVSPVDRISTFIALLFLNFEEMITIKQKHFPNGEITITTPEAEGSPLLSAGISSAPATSELASEA